MSSQNQSQKLLKQVMQVAELLAKAQGVPKGNKKQDKQTKQLS